MKISKHKKFFLNNSIVIITACLLKFTSAQNFSYQNTSFWIKESPSCGGRRQSPIDVSLNNPNIIKHRNKMEIINAKVTMKSAKLLNDGHTVRLVYEWGDKVPMIAGEVLNGTYRLDSTQFHWDTRSNNGSEHTYEGQRAPMEMQSVFYNTKYKSATDALNHDDGFAIFSDLLFIQPSQNHSVGPSGVHHVLSKFPEVSSPGTEINIETFPINTLVPPGSTAVALIIYAGSFTAPPCTENVIWLLNRLPHYINETQLKNIQNSVQLGNHDDHNFRETQPLNGRKLLSINSESI